uniref:F-box domain-containing protein n=1 Tax=Emiliania huxleyi TaxID=2903 RepID=A0A7S3VZ89_EMIHU
MLALLQEVVPIMVASGQNLQANELMRLVSCCRVLRATLQNLELDLSARPSPAPRLLQFIALNAARFQLVSVDVDRCTQEAFDALLLVPGLRALTVRGPASSIRSLAGAERARSLQTLRLLKGVSVALADDLSPLAACRPLTHLCLYGPAPLTSLGPLACCARLESLDLRGCEALVDVEPLVSAGRAACHGLRSLSLRGCRSLRVVSPLRALLALESLDLSCTLVSDVSMLCECPKLKTLTLTGCASLSDVAPLVGLDGECEISR